MNEEQRKQHFIDTFMATFLANMCAKDWEEDRNAMNPVKDGNLYSLEVWDLYSASVRSGVQSPASSAADAPATDGGVAE